MRIINLSFFLFFFSVSYTQKIAIDMTAYQTGFFLIVLQNNMRPLDTIYVNSCGVVNCPYPQTYAVLEKHFSYVYLSKGKIREIHNFLTRKKRLFYKGLYYRPGFLYNRDGQMVIVNQVGNRQDMKIEIEIDSPIFDNLFEKVDRECNEKNQ